jgi:hypothetical protein
MLTVTIRFYLTAGGLVAILAVLLRISWTLGRFRQEFADHIQQDEKAFAEIDKNVRELRARRR